MKYVLALSAGAAVFAAVVFASSVSVNSHIEPEESPSVELGILELSPLGTEGGYAMPASGCSVVHRDCLATEYQCSGAGRSQTCSNVCTSYGTRYVNNCSLSASVETRRYTSSWSSYSGSNRNFAQGNQIQVRWRSDTSDGQNEDRISCSGSGFTMSGGADRSIGNAPGRTNINVTEPSYGNSATYSVNCRYYDLRASDSVRVTNVSSPPPPPAPTVSIEARNATAGGGWVPYNFSINTGQNIYIRWSSSNATACTFAPNSGSKLNWFNGWDSSGAGGTNGDDTTITEPAAGTSETYTVTCTGPGGSASDSILIYKRPAPSAPTGENAICTADGSQVTLSWNAMPNASRYLLRADNNHSSWSGYTCTNNLTYDADGDVCHQNVTSNSITINITPGSQMRWWVHSYGNGATSASGGANYVTCQDTTNFDLDPTTVSGVSDIGINDTLNFSTRVNNNGTFTSDNFLFRFRIEKESPWNSGTYVWHASPGLAVNESGIGPSPAGRDYNSSWTPSAAEYGNYRIRAEVNGTAGQGVTYADTNTGNNLTPSVAFSVTNACTDGIDNDGDGLTDLADPACPDGNGDGDPDCGASCDSGESGRPDLTADSVSPISTPIYGDDGDPASRVADNVQFVGVVGNEGESVSGSITYDFELDLGQNGSIDQTESGALSGGLSYSNTRTTSPVSFDGIPLGDHRIRFVVDPATGETDTSDNSTEDTIGWQNFTVEVVPTDGIPEIYADPRVIRADDDSSPDVTIIWDTDLYPTCSLNGPGLPSSAVSTDGNITGIDGSADIDLNNSATFTIDCGGGNEASVEVEVLPQLFEI